MTVKEGEDVFPAEKHGIWTEVEHTVCMLAYKKYKPHLKSGKKLMEVCEHVTNQLVKCSEKRNLSVTKQVGIC